MVKWLGDRNMEQGSGTEFISSLLIPYVMSVTSQVFLHWDVLVLVFM